MRHPDINHFYEWDNYEPLTAKKIAMIGSIVGALTAAITLSVVAFADDVVDVGGNIQDGFDFRRQSGQI